VLETVKQLKSVEATAAVTEEVTTEMGTEQLLCGRTADRPITVGAVPDKCSCSIGRTEFDGEKTVLAV